MISQQPLQLRIQLLGGFRIQAWDHRINPDQFRLRKARSLVKLLALAPNHRLHRDQLCELLWPENDPGRAANNLHQAVYAARQVLDTIDLPAQEILLFNDEFLSLCPSWPLWIDIDAFEVAATSARHNQDPAVYQAALELYAGDLLPEDPYEDWAANRRESLRQEHLRLLLELGALNDDRQDYQPAIACFQQAVAVEPACEEAHAGLMRLYAQSEQRSAALAQYETCRQLLQRELGAEPSPQTTALYQQIRAGKTTGAETPTPDPVNLPAAVPAAISKLPPVRQTNLPTWLIPFVGRKDLLNEICTRLLDPDCRLLTLTGPGGSGKTRLAVEVAGGMAVLFPDGIFFVPLAGVQSTSSLVPAIAQALSFTFNERRDERLQLLDYLRSEVVLLVLDNFEHLLAASALQGEEGAGILADILSMAPTVKVLVTSQVRLGLSGEILLPVSGLKIPGETPTGQASALATSAVQLFLAGSRRVIPAFEPTPADLEQIMRICRLVQGMPLAILLAAGWMRLLSPTEIAAEIASHSLDFLESEWQDVPERQRSLRSVFDYSWRLLSERERQVFAGLTVFRGDFSYPAAQSVSGASLRDLMKLVNHSLLERTTEGRYQLHELVRQYGEEMLNEFPDHGQSAHDRHATFYMSALKTWAVQLKSPSQLAALAAMDLDINNIRAAWKWAIDRHQYERLAEGWEGLADFYFWRIHLSEGGLPFQQAADLLDEDDLALQPIWLGLWAVLLAFQCFFIRPSSQDERRARLSRSLELVEMAAKSGQDVRRYKAHILWITGRVGGTGNLYDEDVNERKRIISASEALFQEINDHWGEAKALISLGEIAQVMGDYNEAVRCFQKSLVIRRGMGVQLETIETQRDLSLVLSLLGRLEEAEALLRECVTVFRRLGDKSGLAMSLYYLVINLGLGGRYRDASGLEEECILFYEKMGDWLELARVLRRQGQFKIELGEYNQARVALQKSYALFRETGSIWGMGAVKWHFGELALVESQWTEAKQLLLESITFLRRLGARGMLGPPLAALGMVELKLNEISHARQRLAEALQIVNETHEYVTALYILACTLLLLAAEGKIELVVELHALASLNPFFSNSAFIQNLVGKAFTAITSTLPPEVVAAAERRGRQRDLWATITELQADPAFISK